VACRAATVTLLSKCYIEFKNLHTTVKAKHALLWIFVDNLFQVVLFTQNLVVWEQKLYFGKISRNLYSDLQVTCLQFNFSCWFSDIYVRFPFLAKVCEGVKEMSVDIDFGKVGPNPDI
jgi:hypothetical protein